MPFNLDFGVNTAVIAGAGVLVVGLGISTWYYKGKYEDTYKDYVIQMQSAEMMSQSISRQNAEISKLKVDTEKFKAEYQQVIKEKSNKAVETLVSTEVNSCNDILGLIDNLE